MTRLTIRPTADVLTGVQPNPADWDENFPAGWRAKDVAFAEQRAFARIPGTDNPSLDGILYQKEGFDVLSNGFKQAGWKEVKPNQQPTEKNHTYGRTNYMYDHGERGGPMATYLQTALSRSNFNLVMNTEVKRVVRDGGHATGVEIACTGNSGFSKTVNLTAKTGRVILSAGTFGSPKLLYRSTTCRIYIAFPPESKLTLCRWYWPDGPAPDCEQLHGWANHDLREFVDQPSRRLEPRRPSERTCPLQVRDYMLTSHRPMSTSHILMLSSTTSTRRGLIPSPVTRTSIWVS